MKVYKPTTKSRRHMTGIDYRKFLTASEPNKSLTGGFQRHVGRNNYGRLTVRHKGGGVKRLFRSVDFAYDKIDIPAKIESIEYDPNRSGFIGLAIYADGERRYILLPQGVKVGDNFLVSPNAPIKAGNRLPLNKIPVGTFVYNIALRPGGVSVLARSAGNFAEIIAQEGILPAASGQPAQAGYVLIKLPSTEVRKVLATAWASIGSVSNEENHLINIGKAGRSRWLGIRPTVRGSAQNPPDHPYGGGEGRQGRGLRRAKTRWGKPSGKGQKTRTPKKYSNSFIVSRRKVGKKQLVV